MILLQPQDFILKINKPRHILIIHDQIYKLNYVFLVLQESKQIVFYFLTFQGVVWYTERDYFLCMVHMKWPLSQVMVHGKWSLSSYGTQKVITFHIPYAESDVFPGYGKRKVSTFRGMVHGKWINICEYLCELVAKIKNILWAKTRAWWLSVHEKTEFKNLMLQSIDSSIFDVE